MLSKEIYFDALSLIFDRKGQFKYEKDVPIADVYGEALEGWSYAFGSKDRLKLFSEEDNNKMEEFNDIFERYVSYSNLKYREALTLEQAHEDSKWQNIEVKARETLEFLKK